jgi:glycosyltransferase involved in cell wall biosynthesis
LIDATAIPAERGGVGRYVDSLVQALDQDAARIVVVCQDRDEQHYASLAPNAPILTAPESASTRPTRLLWEQTTLPRMIEAIGASVVHSPHYTMPLTSTAASVVTMHDATFFTDPELHNPVKTAFFRSWTRISANRAAKCIAPSQATAVELTRITGAPQGKITVVRHGVDTKRFHPPTPREAREARDALGLGTERYIAFLGSLEPRKNVPALIQGFARACADLAHPPTLVLSGQPGWDTQVESALAAVPHWFRVVRAGYLDFRFLSGFLGDSDLVVYPSLGEGFGLPVLEAMACGAPVLTTQRLAIPEVGGDAVAYCGVTAQEIAVGIKTLLADVDRRADLGRAAAQRALDFTWGQSATAHREVYEKVAWRRACD